MYSSKFSFSRRLSLLNQRSLAENIPKGYALFYSISIISAVYLIIALRLFHTLWYHKLFALLSALIFAYCLQDLYFEKVERKIKQSLPKTTKKLSHYYTHYKGSIIQTLTDTEERCPEEARLYLVKIRKALLSGDAGEEIASLKNNFPFVWFRMLASIIHMAKEKGIGVESNQGQINMIGRSLTKMTNMLNFINVQQGYNDSELKYIQLFLYIVPFLFVFASDCINGKILIEMNMMDVYQSIEAQNIKSYIFLSSNLSALFIHWMRKQQI